jgi:hypothetical protein
MIVEILLSGESKPEISRHGPTLAALLSIARPRIRVSGLESMGWPDIGTGAQNIKASARVGGRDYIRCGFHVKEKVDMNVNPPLTVSSGAGERSQENDCRYSRGGLSKRAAKNLAPTPIVRWQRIWLLTFSTQFCAVIASAAPSTSAQEQSRTSKRAMPAGDCFVGLAASSQ